jgi:hypothetical protein
MACKKGETYLLYTATVPYIVSPNYYSLRLFAYMDATSKLYALLVAS